MFESISGNVSETVGGLRQRNVHRFVKSCRDYPDRTYRSSREVQTYAAAQRSLGAHDPAPLKLRLPANPTSLPNVPL